MPQTRRHPLRLILSLWLGLSLLLAALPAAAFDTKAPHAWVYDLTTRTVLLDKDGDVPVPPASMSKLMTVDMLFEALRDQRVSLDTTFPVSAHAISFTKAGGSTMYLQENDRPTVEELIHGMIINSGNDACVVVAEGLAGSEEAFARQMTERAKEIGLEHSTFTNASGWPDPGQRMSMKDLAMLGARLIEMFPTLYPVFSETEFNYKDRAPANANNRNPLLKLDIGADGLKTGHTEEAGFGMVGSVKQGDRRIIFAISGLQSDKERAQEAERIAQWAFRDFALKTLIPSGQKVADAPVFLGAADQVGLVAANEVRALLPALTQGPVPAEVRYTAPVDAPVAKGQKIGTLTLTPPGLAPQTVDLVAEGDVAKGGYLKRLSTAFAQVLARIRAEIGS